MLAEGEVTKSVSGRLLSPFPKMPSDTNRKAIASLKRLDAWLVKEALLEVAGDDWQTTICPKGPKLSPADRDHLNLVLFGDSSGNPMPSGNKPFGLIVFSATPAPQFDSDPSRCCCLGLGEYVGPDNSRVTCPYHSRG